MPDPNPVTAGAPPSQDTTLPLLRAHPLMGREENMKLLFDRVMKDLIGSEADAIINRDLLHARARLDLRSERNATSFDKALDAIMVLSIANLNVASQTGDTTEQTASGPEHTAEGSIDTSNATVATSNAAIASSIGDIALALANLITATGGIVTAQTLAAVLPTVISAAGASAGTSSSSTSGAK